MRYMYIPGKRARNTAPGIRQTVVCSIFRIFLLWKDRKHNAVWSYEEESK